MSDDELKQNWISQKRTGYITPNNLVLSALFVVWTWLKPELPESLTFIQCSTLSSLVNLIKKKQHYYEELILNYKMKVSADEKTYSKIESSYKDPRTYMSNIRNVMTNIKSSKVLLDAEMAKTVSLKTDLVFIVTTLTTLQTCCYGMYDSLLDSIAI